MTRTVWRMRNGKAVKVEVPIPEPVPTLAYPLGFNLTIPSGIGQTPDHWGVWTPSPLRAIYPLWWLRQQLVPKVF